MQAYVNTRLLRNIQSNNFIELTHHPDLTLDVLKATPNHGWGFHELHDHPNFTIEWVLEFPDRFWNWNRISEKADIHTVANNLDIPWNWSLLTNKFHPSDILKYPLLPWNFMMFHVPEITDEHILFLDTFKHLIPDWKWKYIAENTPWAVFKKAMHLPWVWFIGDVILNTDEFLHEDVEIIRDLELLCDWIKLTIFVHIDIIHAHPDLPWHRDYLQWNKTTWRTPIEPIEKCVRDWVASNTIKRCWKRSISDPSFKMCRDRIYGEFKDLERLVNRMSSTKPTFSRLRDDAIIPSKATPGSIGLDLYSVESYVVFPGQRLVVSTGVSVDIPQGAGIYGRIAPRSGLAVKHGLDVGAGVIDPGDTSEIRVVLFNHDDHRPFVIRPGYRIAQLIFERALDLDFSAEAE